MKVSYDAEVDGMYIRFEDSTAYDGSEEIQAGVVLDFDTEGRAIGLDVTGAHKIVPIGDLGIIITASEAGPAAREYAQALELGRSLADQFQRNQRRLAG